MQTEDKMQPGDKQGDGVDAPRNEGDRNWFALPRWMRFFIEDEKHMPHQGDKEKARRLRQIRSGVLKEENGARP